MAQSHVVSELTEKRGELAEQAEHHRRELERLAQEWVTERPRSGCSTPIPDWRLGVLAGGCGASASARECQAITETVYLFRVANYGNYGDSLFFAPP